MRTFNLFNNYNRLLLHQSENYNQRIYKLKYEWEVYVIVMQRHQTTISMISLFLN